MEYRYLGKTGLQVSALSFGSWLTFGKQVGNDVARECMKIAYDQGVNFFDNAEIYARGQAEAVMGSILQEMGWSRDSYVLSSKVYFGLGGTLKPNQRGLSRKHIYEGLHGSLKRLQADYLDLYFCHRPDYNTPVEETVWAMNVLIQQGKILYWGTSEWPADRIMEAHLVARQNNLIGPAMEQPQYNLFTRDRVEREYLSLYEIGLGTTIWSPLMSGLLTGKYNDGIPEGTRLTMEGMDWLKNSTLVEARLAQVRALTALAQETGISMPQLAIAWTLKNPRVSTAILGASRPEQLTETLRTLDVLPKLTDDVMGKIEAIVGNKPVREVW
jgi:voltage-dependent potassium channel beta subunit